MTFGNYNLHNPRRPGMNPRVLGGADDRYTAIDKSKYCPKCQFALYYFEARGIWFCGKCAWNFPDELLAKNREEQQQQEGQAHQVKGGAAATADDVKEEDIVIMPIQTPRKQNKSKKDELDYLRGDDSYLGKSGLTFVSEVVDLPSGDKEVLNQADLDREKDRRKELKLRGKTIH